MKKVCLLLALAGLFVMSPTIHAQYADSVLSYVSGTGIAAGYTNTSSALGAPALGSSVNPMDPPFAKNQLISIGAGGEITLQMDTPITDNPSHLYGMDFIITANSFFVANGGSGQNETTSGSLFYHAASTLIQVSQDDVNWYTLNPALAPQPGEWFPSYGGGNPQIPVNPALSSDNFAGMTLGQIESLYAGSAGGTGYSLAWAQDAEGDSVDLSSVDYVRIEVQSGVLDMDAITAVPEPSTFALLGVGAMGLLCLRRRKLTLTPALSPRRGGIIARRFETTKDDSRLMTSTRTSYQKSKLPLILLFALLMIGSAKAVTFTENFTNDPAQNGWQVYGDTNLFQWDSANHVMDVTWDSSQTNSYFYLPLCRTLTAQDDFSIAFDINLTQTEAENYGFELALGFLNLPEATSTDFNRSTGMNSPDLVEFDYFPNTSYDFGATVWPQFVDSNSVFNYNGTNDYALYAPNLSDWYHVAMTYSAASQTMVTTMTNFEQTTGITIEDPIMPGFAGFNVDTFSISSYQDDGLGDSIYAQGALSNIVLTLPPAPVAQRVIESESFTSNPLTNGWQVYGDTNLFAWDSTNQVMDVTWDSSQTNSYFYHPLGTTLTERDNFIIAFDMNLTGTEALSYGSELALGFLNLAEATGTNFNRSTGLNSPDLVEFDYFPNTDFDLGATVWPLFIDSTSTFNYNGTNDYAIYTPNLNDWYHITMTYCAANQTMVTTLTNFQQTTGITIHDPIMQGFAGFNVDTFSVSSYQGDDFGDSVYAQGSVSNVVLTLPPVVRHLSAAYNNGVSQVQFGSYVNWSYMLERSTDLVSWKQVSRCVPGTGNVMTLSDTSAPVDKAFYRVSASQP